MVQCPDCESKDRITIAGKVFCANCGTPWTPSPETLKAEAAQKAAAPASASNTVAPTQPISVPATPTPDSPKPETIKPAMPASPLEVTKETQSSQTTSGPMIKVRSLDEKKAASAHIQQTDTISKFAAKPISTMHEPEATPNANSELQSNRILEALATTPEFSKQETPQLEPSKPTTQTSPPQNTSTLSPEPVIPSVGQTITPTAPVAQIDADVEIPDLRDHAQAVLTDKQFNDLADLSTNSPAPSNDDVPLSPATVASVLRTPTVPAPPQPIAPANTPQDPATTPVVTPEPLVDNLETPTAIPVAVTPKPAEPVPAAVSTPTQPVTRLQDMLAPTQPAAQTTTPAQPQSAAPVQPLPAPSQQTDMSHEKLVITPTTQPPTMRLSTSGIDGVSSMSRDQALKLALGDAADTDQNSGGSSYKPLKVAIAVVIVLLIGGYIWQINYPNLAIKIASTRAGLTANAPHYVPSGWSVDRRIVSNQNKIEFTIKSSSGNQLKVTQIKTDWDSAALLESYVSSEADNIETVQAQGLTIYLYGDHQASWINHGNWFRLDGSGSGLSQEELIKIATSL